MLLPPSTLSLKLTPLIRSALSFLRIATTVAAFAALAFLIVFEMSGQIYFRLHAIGDADGPTEISAFIFGLKAGTVRV